LFDIWSFIMGKKKGSKIGAKAGKPAGRMTVAGPKTHRVGLKQATRFSAGNNTFTVYCDGVAAGSTRPTVYLSSSTHIWDSPGTAANVTTDKEVVVTGNCRRKRRHQSHFFGGGGDDDLTVTLVFDLGGGQDDVADVTFTDVDYDPSIPG
jgi:hypothetical protein